MLGFVVALLVLSVSASGLIPLGTISHVTSVTCGSTFYAGAICKDFTISCPGTVDLVVHVGSIQPVGASKGTIFFENGGGGTQVFDNGLIAPILAANFTAVQVQFTSDWTAPGGTFTPNITNDACRPATLHHGIFTAIHGGSLTKGFCGLGHSGGANAIANDLAFYGADDWLDYALENAGPNFANTTAACVVPQSPRVVVCPNGQSYCSQTSEQFTIIVEFPPCSHANAVNYACNCSTTNPSNATQIASWKSQSIISGTMSYTRTKVSSWVCSSATSGGFNNDPGQAQLYAAKVSATNGYSLNIIQNCVGSEGTWTGVYQPTGVSGLTTIANNLINNCVPRH